MREIKFRAWDKKDKKMYYVGYGEGSFETNGAWWELTINENQKASSVFGDYLMQYTGLKDKNGKEIYEGDIVKCWEAEYCEDNHIAEVGYCSKNDYPAFDLEPYPHVDSNAISYYKAIGHIEVIGNIYDNPELLLLK